MYVNTNCCKASGGRQVVCKGGKARGKYCGTHMAAGGVGEGSRQDRERIEREIGDRETREMRRSTTVR